MVVMGPEDMNGIVWNTPGRGFELLLLEQSVAIADDVLLFTISMLDPLSLNRRLRVLFVK